nr:LuxR C-terminal-related transcriptional regulator [Gordonia humi]
MGGALARLRRRSGVSVAFGGPVGPGGDLILERFDGPTVGALAGLAVSLGEGLGGKVVALRRTAAVKNYFDTDAITHRYDRLIRAEGFRSVVASPVIVHRRTIAVIYGAYRSDEVAGGRVQDAITQETRALEQQLVVHEALAGATRGRSTAEAESAGLREQLRAADAGLRRLAASADDPALRGEIDRIIRGLAAAPAGDAVAARVTTREADVLSLAGQGLTNARIAEALGLTVYTVKSYMKSAMSKLGAVSRLEAIVIARRAGVIA